MRKATQVVLTAILVATGVTMLMRPSVIGAVAALAGRTHLVVPESGIKMLSATTATMTPPFEILVSLQERARDGSLGGTYIVPNDKVFILTDVRLDAVPGTREGHEFFARLAGPGGDRWLFSSITPNPADVQESHFASGIVYDAGSTVDFAVSSASPHGDFWLRFDVLGYETEARQ